MDNKPIYEPEPLPASGGSKTGLPHSSYEQMRIRSIAQEKSITAPAWLESYIQRKGAKRAKSAEPLFPETPKKITGVRESQPVKETTPIEKQKQAKLNVDRHAITAKFHEVAASMPEAHPDDVRLATESWANRTIGRGAPNDHADHLTTLTRGLDEQTARHPAMRERAALITKVGLTRGEKETAEDVVEPTKSPRLRRTTDNDVRAVARDLARSHYSQNFEGKIKNELTGEQHPAFKDSLASKSPMVYLKKHLGVEDVAYHIESNHADAIQQKARERAGEPEYELSGGTGKPPVPPTERPGFALEYMKSPIAATDKSRSGSFGKGQVK